MDGVQALVSVLLGGDSGDGSVDLSTLVETAFVTNVTAGGGRAGSDLVTVSWRGATVTAACLDTYTSPAVGDEVLIVHHADRPYILGRLTGQPV